MGIAEIKDFLTLFLQITALIVLLAVWIPLRRAQISLATPLLVVGLDAALREKTYGGSPCLEAMISKFKQGWTDGERFVFGFRSPVRNREILEQFAQWQPFEVAPITTPHEDPEARAQQEIIYLNHMFDIPQGPGEAEQMRIVRFPRGLLQSVHETLSQRYGYNMETLTPGDVVADRRVFAYVETVDDLFADLVQRAKAECTSKKDFASAYWDIGRASKIVNVLRIHNPHDESLSKIHLRIARRWMGPMELATSVAEREGFEVLNNTMQHIHLVLDELPPNADRYCVVETRSQPLSENSIELESRLIDKLSPSLMRRITIGAALVALAVVATFAFLGAKLVDV